MEDLFDPIEFCDFPQSSSQTQSHTNSVPSDLNHDRIVEELYQLTNEIPTLNEQFKEITRKSTDNVTIGENIEQPQQQPEEPVFKLKEPPDLNEILTTDEAAITPTSHNVGVLNAACQKALKDLEQQLLFMLKANRKEQEIVQNYLDSNGKSSGSEVSKKLAIKCAGIPYFKDLDGYLPPQNEDVLRKKRNQQFLPIDFIDNSCYWAGPDVKNLLKAVNPESKPLVTDAVDWMKISVTDMGGKFSPSECKSKWMMNIRPGINKSKWKLKEIKSLEKIAERHNYQDWDKISEELGTNRTSFQCCVQYQSYRAKNGGKWTKEEDETLKKLINKYKVKDHIPWKKVAWHFEDRSLRQCQERYLYCLGNIKKGNFTMEEDFILAYLATKLKNFGEVAKYLPKRVSTQVRARFEYLVKTSMPNFTKEEDKLLTKLVYENPGNWGKISESFENRSKLQCRGRWAAIQKDIELENDAISDTELEEAKKSPDRLGINNKDKMDSVRIRKNLSTLSKPEIIQQKTRKCPEEYVRLLEYHHHCYKFLFGPKSKYLINSEALEKITKKLRIAMTVLSVHSTSSINSFDLSSLSKDSEFDEEDSTVLNIIKTEDKEMKSRYTIIPPNYVTLVGLRSLKLSCDKIKNSYEFYKRREPSPRVEEVDSNDRLLCSDAKKLFKSRMKALFALPLIFSNISQEGIQTKPVYKPKVRKTKKPLSKLKRKTHAKLMTQSYRKLLQEKLNKKLIEIGDSDRVHDDEDSTTIEKKEESRGVSAGKKRGRPRKIESKKETSWKGSSSVERNKVKEVVDESPPVKRKRGRPSKEEKKKKPRQNG